MRSGAGQVSTWRPPRLPFAEPKNNIQVCKRRQNSRRQRTRNLTWFASSSIMSRSCLRKLTFSTCVVNLFQVIHILRRVFVVEARCQPPRDQSDAKISHTGPGRLSQVRTDVRSLLCCSPWAGTTNYAGLCARLRIEYHFCQPKTLFDHVWRVNFCQNYTTWAC
jgi:hypothetical protein